MTSRLARLRLPYALLLALLAVVALGDILRVIHTLQSDSPAYERWFETSVNALTFGSVGAVVARHHPRNAVGWIFLGVGGASALQLLTGTYAMYAHYVRADALPAGAVAGWLSSTVVALALAVVLPIAIILFPDGRPVSRAWRGVIWFCAIDGAAFIAVLGLLPGPLGGMRGLRNPFGILPPTSPPRVWFTSTAIGLVACCIAAVASLAIRWRSSDVDARQQIKWVVFAGVSGPSAILLVSLLLPRLTATWFGSVLWAAGIGVIPVAAGVSILRYRLYDIDRLISRTVGYTVMTGLLGAGYIALVTVATRLTPTSDSLAVAGATLAAAAVFQPLRRRVQDAVDRRFNRARFDAARTIDDFAARLRGHVDLDALQAELLTVVRQTMQPRQATLWVSERGVVPR